MVDTKFTVFLAVLIMLASLSVFAMPIYVKPLSSGVSQPNTLFNYTFNFTSDSACTGVLFSNKSKITTGEDGVGFVNIDIDSLSAVPNYLCEYKNNALRATHALSSETFRNVYLQNVSSAGFIGINTFLSKARLHVTGNAIINGSLNMTAKGNITNANVGWFTSLRANTLASFLTFLSKIQGTYGNFTELNATRIFKNGKNVLTADDNQTARVASLGSANASANSAISKLQSTNATRWNSFIATNTSIWSSMLTQTSLNSLRASNATANNAIIKLQQSNATLRASNATQALSLAALVISNATMTANLNKKLNSSVNTANLIIKGTLNMSNTGNITNVRYLSVGSANKSSILTVKSTGTASSPLTVFTSGAISGSWGFVLNEGSGGNLNVWIYNRTGTKTISMNSAAGTVTVGALTATDVTISGVVHGMVSWLRTAAAISGTTGCDYMDSIVTGWTYTCSACLNTTNHVKTTCAETTAARDCACTVD